MNAITPWYIETELIQSVLLNNKKLIIGKYSMKKCLTLFCFLFCWQVYATPTHFDTYANSRFNYQVEYPSFLVPQGEAANGDGQNFTGNDANLKVYGTFSPELDLQQNANNYNIEDEFNNQRKELVQHGYNLPYTLLKGNYFVISGERRKQIVYLKKIYVANCGVHLYLWINYPKADKKIWDPLVTTISDSFKYRTAQCVGDYKS